MKYSLFIGRWQPWHEGHRWLIDQRLKKGFNVCIAIREVEKSDSNNKNDILTLNNQAKSNKSEILVLDQMIE